jgi:glycosyltransferase involved in cell wall biosynthesis
LTPGALRPKTVTVVILTYNEAENLSHALESIKGWCDETHVLDSFSTDGTQEIARNAGCTIYEHHFDDYAKQRNYALEQLPITTEWVLFLDADEWVTDALKTEISQLIEWSPIEDGFYLNRRFIWMGKWIRRGYYPSWILRLFRNGKARCEDRGINEQMIVDGTVGYLKHDFMHEDRKGVGDWIAKHNAYATREARELLRTSQQAGYREVDASLFGGQAHRKRWLRQRVWGRLPPIVRPFIYFTHRYVLAGGFLDGRAALIYHFLHALWYPLLTDVKYLEMKRAQRDARREAA